MDTPKFSMIYFLVSKSELKIISVNVTVFFFSYRLVWETLNLSLPFGLCRNASALTRRAPGHDHPHHKRYSGKKAEKSCNGAKQSLRPNKFVCLFSIAIFIQHVSLKYRAMDFPGGAVVKNPPANAGDTGLSPGPGRSHMPWSN